MAVSRLLRRLLHVLHVQEEQSRTALAAALAGLHRLEHAQASAQERERGGRRLIAASALSSDLIDQRADWQTADRQITDRQIINSQIIDRLAGVEESLAAARTAAILAVRAAAAENQVALCREEFLARRIERRQAEALVRQAEAADAVAANRRSQQSLDDWYLNRLRLTGEREK